MPSAFDSLAKAVSFLTNLLSLGKGLDELFGDGGLDTTELADMIVDEVKQVFIRVLEMDDITFATSAEEAAVQWLTDRYGTRVTAGDSDADLYLKIASDPGPSYVKSLSEQLYVMENWANSSKESDTDLAQQTISLYFTLALTILSFYQEGARRSTGVDRKSELGSIQTSAGTYHDKVATLIANVDAKRLAAVSGLVAPAKPFPGMPSGVSSFSDSWTGGLFLAGGHGLPGVTVFTSDPVGTIVPLYDNYMSLLATGDDATVDALHYLLQSSNPSPSPYSSMLDASITAAAAYGTWISSSKASLANLLRLKDEPLGSPPPQTTADRVFVFARDTKNGPSFIRQSSTGKFGWSDWAPLGGRVDQLAAIRNTDGRVEVFGRGTDRCLYHMWQLDTTDATWSPWISLGGSVSSFTVAQNGNGSLEVFALDANGVLSHAWQGASTSTGWSDWTSLGGVSSSIAVGRNDDGRLEVFGIGTDNAVYYTSQGASTETGWSAWSSLGGWSDMLAVAENAFGRIEVFARGSDKALYHIWQDWTEAGGWSQWARLGNTIDLLAVGTNPDGRLEVFARGTDQALRHIWQDPLATGGWSEWAPLGGTIDMLATARNADGRIEVLSRGSDKALYHMWQDTSTNNGWSAWTSLGGSIDLLAVPAYVRPVSPSGGANKWR